MTVTRTCPDEVADEAADVLGAVGAVPEGTVRLGAPVGVAHHPLAALLRTFAERHPRVQVELSVTDRPVDLLAEGFDVLLSVRFPPAARSVITRRLGVERLLVCGALRYFSRHPAPQTPEQLLRHNCLLMRGRAGWTFRTDRDRLVLPVSGTLVVDNVAVLRRAALEGLGVAWLPASLVEADVREGRLRTVLDAFAPETFDINLHYPQRQHVPKRVRVLIDFLAENFRRALGRA